MKAALKENRDKAAELADAHFAKKFKGEDEDHDKKEDTTETPGPDSESVPMDLDTSNTSNSQYDFGEGIPSNFKGQYEIMGVVTHKGRSADSGDAYRSFCKTCLIMLLL